MERISQSLVSKITNLQKRLESLLDNDFDVESEGSQKEGRAFEVSRDLSLVRGISTALPDDHIDRAIVAFSRLSMFFDAGVILENNDSQWKAQAYFFEGSTHLLKNDAKSAFKIPQMTLLSVLKTDSKTVLTKLNLQQLDPNNKTTCLLIKVTHDFAFVLFSSMPDIWLKDHVEQIRTALINGFAD